MSVCDNDCGVKIVKIADEKKEPDAGASVDEKGGGHMNTTG